MSRVHGDLAPDQQQELLTVGQLSGAELAQKEASVVPTNRRRQGAFNPRLRKQRRKASYVHNNVAPNGSHDEQMQDYIKAEQVCTFTRSDFFLRLLNNF